MNELQASLKIVLANTFAMYFKAHSYHWNVEGPNFSEYHKFLGDLYDELFGAIDPIAEHIRTLDTYAPISMGDLHSGQTIRDDLDRPGTAQEMFNRLLAANDQVVSALHKTFQLAEIGNNQGLMNYIADRLDIHAKHAWMLKSFNKE